MSRHGLRLWASRSTEPRNPRPPTRAEYLLRDYAQQPGESGCQLHSKCSKCSKSVVIRCTGCSKYSCKIGIMYADSRLAQ